MKKNIIIIWVVICMVFTLSYCFKSPTKALAYDGKSKWQQNEFVLSTFHAVQGINNGFSNQLLIKCKEANLNQVELTFTSKPAIDLALDICDAIGLKVIVQDYDLFGGFQDINIAPTTEQDVIAAINKYTKHPSFEGYFIWDEPYLNQFSLVRKNVDWFAKNDPNHLLYVVAQQSSSPTYNWDNGTFKNYVDKYVEIINPPIMVSNQYYFYWDIDKGKKLSDMGYWNDLGYLRKKALEKNIPFWYYAQLIGDIEKNTTSLENMNESRVRFEVSTLLAYGVKGISYYNTIHSIMDEYGRPTYLFDAVKKINAETLQLGKTFVKLKSTLVYHTGYVKADYINKLGDSQIISSAPDGLIFGEYESPKGGKYVYISNGSYDSPFNGTVQLKNSYKIYKVNRLTGRLDLAFANANNIPLNLIAGNGELYVFTGLNEAAPYDYGNVLNITASSDNISKTTSKTSSIDSTTKSTIASVSETNSNIEQSNDIQTSSIEETSNVDTATPVSKSSPLVLISIIFAILILAGGSGFIIFKKNSKQINK